METLVLEAEPPEPALLAERALRVREVAEEEAEADQPPTLEVLELLIRHGVRHTAQEVVAEAEADLREVKKTAALAALAAFMAAEAEVVEEPPYPALMVTAEQEVRVLLSLPIHQMLLQSSLLLLPYLRPLM